MKKELSKKYQPQQVEADKYEKWLKTNQFQAGEVNKAPFTIVIPPPNVTGKLHLGHAWDNTLQDILIRYQHLLGKDTLYLPGMDHAGIATQAKIEERLRSEGTSAYKLGRAEFLKRAWAWKAEYASHIREQWAKLGIAVDYSRERFTLDEGLNRAVNKVFIDLYQAGLIYQGERIINWDVEAKTALSNIEVIHKEIKGAFYTFNYPIVGSNETLVVATTRPETMFGDVCLVVNPKDARFNQYIGRFALNPANHQPLKIIGDEYVEMEFGTGVMKCTPAHDPNDFNLALKYNLDKIICLNPDGTMNELAGEFAGLDRFACRKALVKRIEAEGNLIEIKEHYHQVGHSERTDSIVEPYLSKQWFVKMQPLAREVLKYQTDENQKLNFYPARFEQVFTTWLENIEDWCISRQLWWGHRIPAYYHKTTGEIYVGETAPSPIEDWDQDEDVLDTWFSSALWPFSTLGWPTETADFKRYYPTSVMVTGYDIIFFWVARMAFTARYFTASRPFKDVLIHGLIRDEQGRKMSKSLGNGVDPMDVIAEYGVDALRFFLTTNSSPGQDIRYQAEKVEAAWNFINKLWNAARFVELKLTDESLPAFRFELTSAVDHFILAKLDQTIINVKAQLDKYEISLAGNELYHFVWDDFCDWYIELSKANLNSTDQALKTGTLMTLKYVLNQILVLLHPFIPFVTDEIYTSLNDENIYFTAYPTPLMQVYNISEIELLIKVISSLRELKVTYNLKPQTPLAIKLLTHDLAEIKLSTASLEMLELLSKASVVSSLDKVVTVPLEGAIIQVEQGNLVDYTTELARLEKESATLQTEIDRSLKILNNPNFMAKAKPEKIALEQAKLADYQQQLVIVKQELNNLIKSK